MAKATTKKVTPVAEEEILSADHQFVKEYLVQVDDSSSVSDALIEVNKRDVVDSALRSGLRAVAEVRLESKTIVDARNVKLVYSVVVETN